MLKVLGIKSVVKNKFNEIGLGVSACGDNYILTNFKKAKELYLDIDCFLQFNIFNPYLRYKNKTIPKVFKYILKSKKPFLVGEEGSFRQFPDYKKFGWFNYKNNLGNFNNNNVDNSRWIQFKNKNNLVINDWNSKGDYILIMGQVEYDSALIELYNRGYCCFIDFVIDTINEIRRYTDRPIIYRPHPKDRNKDLSKLLEFSKVIISENYSTDDIFNKNGGLGLEEDLNRAYCVVSFNSNSTVEAVCKGVPVFSLDITSPTYEISNLKLENIEIINYDIDITEWCNKISYTIWNTEEISNGAMWSHLRSVYE